MTDASLYVTRPSTCLLSFLPSIRLLQHSLTSKWPLNWNHFYSLSLFSLSPCGRVSLCVCVREVKGKKVVCGCVLITDCVLWQFYFSLPHRHPGDSWKLACLLFSERPTDNIHTYSHPVNQKTWDRKREKKRKSSLWLKAIKKLLSSRSPLNCIRPLQVFLNLRVKVKQTIITGGSKCMTLCCCWREEEKKESACAYVCVCLPFAILFYSLNPVSLSSLNDRTFCSCSCCLVVVIQDFVMLCVCVCTCMPCCMCVSESESTCVRVTTWTTWTEKALIISLWTRKREADALCLDHCIPFWNGKAGRCGFVCLLILMVHKKRVE